MSRREMGSKRGSVPPKEGHVWNVTAVAYMVFHMHIFIYLLFIFPSVTPYYKEV